MHKRATKIDLTASGCPGPHTAAFVDCRLEQLEALCAEVGARVAALEGIVFALQNRVRELEATSSTERRTAGHKGPGDRTLPLGLMF